jgi:hypothetical protein
MRFVRAGPNKWTSYGQIITHTEKILKEKFLPDSEKVRIPIITTASIIEHTRMSIRPRVWVIHCLQDFSKLFVRPQEDEDE